MKYISIIKMKLANTEILVGRIPVIGRATAIPPCIFGVKNFVTNVTHVCNPFVHAGWRRDEVRDEV